jgi:peptidyl-tRNA hydrolase, PTH1 family
LHIIAGLGNPGRGYQKTRHNVGFMVINRIAKEAGIKIRGFKYKARTGKGKIDGHKVFLIKPRTYMNLSGKSVESCLNGLSAYPSDLIVIHDDLDLPIGRIKIKNSGGTGGHKGIRSIIDHLGTDQFTRVRIGIGKPPHHQDTADYVLENFSPAEKNIIQGSIVNGAEAVQIIISDGTDKAMNKFNQK